MAAPTILALDIASSTGWAFGPADDRPSFGTWRLQGGSRGALGAALIVELSRALKSLRPDMVALEEPLHIAALARKLAALNNFMITHGLVVVAESVAYCCGVQRVLQAPTQTVRKHFVGQRTFKPVKDPVTRRTRTGRDEAKLAVQARCRQLGYPVANDNEGDAVALWHYFASRAVPARAVEATPLFAGASA